MNEMHRMKKINGYSFHLLHVLGSGSYGKVFLGKKDDTDERVAIKMIEKSKLV